MYRVQNIHNIISKYVLKTLILKTSVTPSYKNALSNGRQYSQDANNFTAEKSKLSSIKEKVLNIGFKLLFNAGPIIGPLMLTITLYYIDYMNKHREEQEKRMEKLFISITEFILEYEKSGEDNPIDLDGMRKVTQNIIIPILSNKDFQQYILKNVRYNSENYYKLLTVSWYVSKEFINHFYNIEDVAQLLSFIINDIYTNEFNRCTPPYQGCQLLAEIYFQDARILYFSKKIPKTYDTLKVLRGMIQKHSYLEIKVKHLLHIIELQDLQQDVNFNFKLKKIELVHDSDKPKIEKLLEVNAGYIREYESLKEEQKGYIITHHMKKQKYIIPKKYISHQLMCQQTLLRLYTKNLLLKAAIGIHDEDDVQHIYNIIQYLQHYLYSDNEKSYNKLIHCHLLDTYSVLAKITEGDDKFNKKVINLMKHCVTQQTLKEHYEKNSTSCLETSYINTQFHCLQDKIDRTSDSKILCEYMQNCYKDYVKPFSVGHINVIGETNDS